MTSPKQWYKKFSSKLTNFAFIQSDVDHCLFTMSNESEYLTLVVYVDGVLIWGTTQNRIEQLKKFLHEEFTIKDLGEADYFLEIELEQSTKGTFMSQQKYNNDILLETNLCDSKLCPTPFPTRSKLHKDKGN